LQGEGQAAAVLTDRKPENDFQSRVFAAYEAIHAALDHLPLYPSSPTSPEQKGALAGQFIVSDSVSGVAATLPQACLLGGACYLGMDANAEAARDMLRHGRCDFVVNSMDEALRILKNELRQKKPVAVCLSGDVPVYIQEMADRGVSPQLFMHALSPKEYPAFARLHDTGTKLCETSGLEDLLGRAPNEDGALTRWTLPSGNAAVLARLDAVARDILPAADRKRRRWLEAAARYLPRQLPPSRIASLTEAEMERFVDAISARLMSGDIPGTVNLAIDDHEMVLGHEAVA
jgi:urocanate hydratase